MVWSQTPRNIVAQFGFDEYPVGVNTLQPRHQQTALNANRTFMLPSPNSFYSPLRTCDKNASNGRWWYFAGSAGGPYNCASKAIGVVNDSLFATGGNWTTSTSAGSFVSMAKEDGTLLWTRIFNYPGWSEGVTHVGGDQNGNVWFAGSSNDWTASDLDVVFGKMRPDGTPLFFKAYTSPYADSVADVLVIDPNSILLAVKNQISGYLMMLDSLGNIKWAKTGFPRGIGVAQVSSTKIMVTQTYPTPGMVFHILDMNGNYVSGKSYTFPRTVTTRAQSMADPNRIVLAGMFSETSVFYHYLGVTLTLPMTQSNLLMVDSLGNLVWSKRFVPNGVPFDVYTLVSGPGSDMFLPQTLIDAGSNEFALQFLYVQLAMATLATTSEVATSLAIFDNDNPVSPCITNFSVSGVTDGPFWTTTVSTVTANTFPFPPSLLQVRTYTPVFEGILHACYECDVPTLGTTSVTGIGSTRTFYGTASLHDTLWWDFGDGTSSSSYAITHTYAMPGIYEACFIAENDCGPDSACFTINLCPATSWSVTSVPICGGDTLFAANTTTPLDSTRWLLDGAAISSLPNLHLIGIPAGSHTLTMISMTGLCRDTLTQTIVFSTDPGDLVPDQSGCEGDTLTVTPVGGPFSSYAWSTGSSSSSINLPLPMGITQQVTVTDSVGCAYVDSFSVLTHALPIATLPSTATGCDHDTLVITPAGGPYPDYLWSTGDTSMSLEIILTGSGIYSVTVTSSDGCTSSDTTMVAVHPLPLPSLPDTLEGCQGDTLLLLPSGGPYVSTYWSSGDTTPALTFTATGMWTVTLLVTDTNGCEAYDTSLVNLLPFTAPALTDVETCGDSIITLSPGSYASYDWSTGDTSSTLDVSTSGTYTVSVTASNGCSGSASAMVSILSASFTALMGVGTSYTFTNTSTLSGSCNWSFGDGTFSTLCNPTHSFPGPGTYTVCLTITTPTCVDSVCQVINIIATQMEPSTEMDWIIYPNPSDGIFNLVCISPTHAEGIYTLTDPLGRIVQQGQLPWQSQPMQIDLRDLPDGNYYLHLLCHDVVASLKLTKL